jgi:hypothetical protein
VGNEQAHVVQFYTKDSFLLDGLCEFVRCALEDGESVILVVSQAHRDGLRQRIKAARVRTRIASRTGRYVVLDAAETMAKFMTGNMPDRRKFESVMGMVIRRAEGASRAKYRRVAIFGEMVALLWAEKKFNAAIRLEQLWNELAQTHFFLSSLRLSGERLSGRAEARALRRGLRRALGGGARRGRCLISICGR